METRYFCQGAAGEQYLDQLFRIFDKDGDGSIDFKVELSNSTNPPKGSFEKYEYHSLGSYQDKSASKITILFCTGVHDCNRYEQLWGSGRKAEVNQSSLSLS